jgi:tRNA-dihydrouridine synthase B
MRQFAMAMAQKGEKIACLEARKHYAWYLRGVRGASRWKDKICHVATMEDLSRLTDAMKRDLG